MKVTIKSPVSCAILVATLVCILMVACDSDKPTIARWGYDWGLEVGDVNVNGQPCEIADYVLFRRYFLYGEAVFAIDKRRQIRNTDIDRDGDPLKVSDLARLLLIVIGEYSDPHGIMVPISSDVQNDGGLLSVSGDLGAAFLIVEGDVIPGNHTSLEMDYDFNGTNTHIILSGDVNGANHNFTGDFIDIYNGKLLHLELASAEGGPVKIHFVDKAANDFDIVYPNPFKDSVHVAFYLLTADSATLRIRDALGTAILDSIVTRDTVRWIQTYVWDAHRLPDGLYVAELEVLGTTRYRKLYKDESAAP